MLGSEDVYVGLVWGSIWNPNHMSIYLGGEVVTTDSCRYGCMLPSAQIAPLMQVSNRGDDGQTVPSGIHIDSHTYEVKSEIL